MANLKGNIYIKHGDSGVYLYTNTSGDILPKILQDALKRGVSRWGDSGTLTRIIFSEMIQRDVFGMNSFAITPHLIDNENLILVVDDVNEKVGVFGPSGKKFNEIAFNRYITIANPDWYNVSNGYTLDQDRGANHRRLNPYIF